MSVEVWCDGVSLSTFCRVSNVGWTTRLPYGDYDATFTVDADPNGHLRRGKSVVITDGSLAVWSGEMAEPDWETGQMAATGLIRRCEDYLSLVWDTTVLALVPTWNPRTAIDDAITPTLASGRDAIGFTRDSSVPNVDLRPGSEVTDTPYMSDAAGESGLFNLATKRGKGWPYMGPDRVLRFYTSPFTAGTLLDPQPIWYVHPDVVDLGESGGTERGTQVFVDYMAATALSWTAASSYTTGDVVIYRGTLWKATASSSGVAPYDGSTKWSSLGQPPAFDATTDYNQGDYVVRNSTVYRAVTNPAIGSTPPNSDWTSVGSFPIVTRLHVADSTIKPYREVIEDATDLGDMTGTEATAIANQALAEGLQPSYTTDIPVTPLTVTNIKGQPCEPINVRAGQVVRVWGAAHPHLGTNYIDITAGEVTVSDADTDSPTAVIKPYGKQARTFQEVSEAGLNASRAA